jgi:hypothetical protein
MGMLLCVSILLGEAGWALASDSFYVISGSSSASDIKQLKAAVATLQSQVAALQGKIFPYGLVNMYEDATVKIELTGESKTITDSVNRKATVALRLLITNKTNSNIYLGYEHYTSSVADEYGKGQSGDSSLNGINDVYGSTSNGYDFSAIGPKSSITAEWISANSTTFYDSHYLTASFGFVLFASSGNTRFNAGFTGITLP